MSKEKIKKDTTPKCSNCGFPLKHIPEGVSKRTGKPYGEFWVCTNEEKDEFGHMVCGAKYNPHMVK
jgi:ribosomal protein L34E